jgi:hypothetical protein
MRRQSRSSVAIFDELLVGCSPDGLGIHHPAPPAPVAMPYLRIPPVDHKDLDALKR